MACQRIVSLPLVLCLLWLCAFGDSKNQDGQTVAVLLSEELSPYQELLKGFSKKCSAKIRQYDMQKDPQKGVQILKTIQENNTDLIFAVGHHAIQLYLDEKPQIPALYSMVLNPWRIGLDQKKIPGINLNLSVKEQLQAIVQTFPQRKRIAVPYDPKYNDPYLKEISQIATEFKRTILPIPVASERDLPEQFKKYLSQMDLLWLIPDVTVITKGNLDFMLQNSLLNLVPMVGYNAHFAQKGAVLAFSIDYVEMGAQAAEIANAILSGTYSSTRYTYPPSKMDLLINLKVALKIGITIPSSVLNQAKEVIR